MNVLPQTFAILVTLSIIKGHQHETNNATKNPHKYYCYTTDNRKLQQDHYSLETPRPSDLSRNYEIPDCYPSKIWVVTRHGTRYPAKTDSMAIGKFLPYLQSLVKPNKYLCEQDYQLIKNWTMYGNPVPCSLTNPQGWDDIRELAKSFQQIYPTLFDTKYSPEKYTFAHSSATRTKQSCEAFTETLFGAEAMINSSRYWSTNNSMLMPWANCPEFIKNSNFISSNKSQANQFKNTKHFAHVRRLVTHRLGFEKNLADIAIDIMWMACRYQAAFHLQNLSPWCAAFTLNDALVLEYLSDLGLYYKLSYGSDQINSKLPCIAIKDMIDHLTDETSSNKVTAYFSHAELLTMIITALDIMHDSELLRADNYDAMKNRKFRSSKWSPFASSFAAVKYNCPSVYPGEKDEIKVLMLLNQQPIKMPWCKDKVICKIDELQNKFNNSTMRDCPYGICGKKWTESSVSSETDEDC